MFSEIRVTRSRKSILLILCASFLKKSRVVHFRTRANNASRHCLCVLFEVSTISIRDDRANWLTRKNTLWSRNYVLIQKSVRLQGRNAFFTWNDDCSFNRGIESSSVRGHNRAQFRLIPSLGARTKRAVSFFEGSRKFNWIPAKIYEPFAEATVVKCTEQ